MASTCACAGHAVARTSAQQEIDASPSEVPPTAGMCRSYRLLWWAATEHSTSDDAHGPWHDPVLPQRVMRVP